MNVEYGGGVEGGAAYMVVMIGPWMELADVGRADSQRQTHKNKNMYLQQLLCSYCKTCQMFFLGKGY